MSEQYIGVMSGTSLDGVDVVLCEIGAHKPAFISALEYPFDPLLKAKILEMIEKPSSLEAVGKLDHQLGHLFAKAINALLQREEILSENITAIGLHGQTLWHQPFGDTPFTMQLGDANIVYAQTGIKVVADFRRLDVAHGGQGAPFAPAFHQSIFNYLGDDVAVLNLGGIANITFLGLPTGFDVGPANVLLDYWIDKNLNKPFDKKGEWARSGNIHQPLLNTLLSESYFNQTPPKSTGRELFNGHWLEEKLQEFSALRPVDVQATLLELSVLSIAEALEDKKIKHLILCGGGAKNLALIVSLSKYLKGCTIKPSDDYGVSSDYMEALAFAWLARQRVHNRVINLSSITGAKKDSIIGAIYG